LVLEAPHPSPLSCYRGFQGCQHFSKANQYFKHNGLKQIDWALDSAEDNSEQMMLTF
jgi:uracil-DNA glycosylase